MTDVKNLPETVLIKISKREDIENLDPRKFLKIGSVTSKYTGNLKDLPPIPEKGFIQDLLYFSLLIDMGKMKRNLRKKR